jgi:hypothetical protein
VTSLLGMGDVEGFLEKFREIDQDVTYVILFFKKPGISF